MGIQSTLLALNDRHAKEDGAEAEGAGDARVPVRRLTGKWSWDRRLACANQLVGSFQPDWVSLQYVPYGFQKKGLPFFLPKHLESLGGKFRWHVMCHELWIEPKGGWIKRVLSGLQKALVMELCRSLKPGKVHTSIPYYRERLEAAGVGCGELPLFGNIPVVPQEIPSREDEWTFAFFGSLRNGWEPEPLLSRIELARASAGKSRCRFISIGRLGETGEKIWEQMEQIGYANFVFEKRGELSAADISRELQSADFGIAVSPHHLLGKSGAVAAMREHGLPVIVTRMSPGTASAANRWTEIPLDDHFFQNLAAAKRSPVRDRLPEIAEAFLRSLENMK
jgi:hypothetical protein